MCGIYASDQGPRFTGWALRSMSYRGPDEMEVLGAGCLHVGLARLAIVGVASPQAKQPIWTKKQRIICFNGEIYNWRHLSRTAESEIQLLGDMLDEGLDPRQFVDGDYAILYYDPSNHRLTLYRDRFGFCPLYYQTKRYLAVSSERRKLVHAREVPAHGKVVLDTWNRKVLEVSRLPHYGITASSSDLYATRMESLVEEAVTSRAVHTDVGYSLALSGGIDSSLVALICKRFAPAPVDAVCVAPSADSTDLQHARKVANLARIPLTEVILTEDMLREALPLIREHLDCPGYIPQPMKWRAAVRNWFVAKHCKTKVILCGEGADEVVEGYPPHNLLSPTYRVLKHQLTAINSLPAINLDRTNKLGLAHSKEFRAPFLASTLSYFLMSTERVAGKQVLRDQLRRFDVHPELLVRGKWSNDEKALDQTLDLLVKEMR